MTALKKQTQAKVKKITSLLVFTIVSKSCAVI